MARIVSTTTAGVPTDPTGGMTLDALMARQKLLAERGQQIAEPRSMVSPWQGAAALAQQFVNARQESANEDQLTAGRQQLAQAISGIDPNTGEVPQAAIASAMAFDPDTGMKLLQGSIEARRAARAQELAASQRSEDRQWAVEDRQAGYGHEADVDKRELGQTIDAEKRAAATQGAQPLTGQAKLAADLAAGRIDKATYDAAMAKENAMPGSGVTINTGDGSSALTKKFDEKEGEGWAALMDAGAKAGSVRNDLQLLDELGKVTPTGPVPGYLMKMFPGVDSAGAAYQSIINRVAPSLRVTGSGSTSDIEYEGMLKSLPSLSNYPEANQLIGAMMKAKAELDIQRADIITKWRNSSGVPGADAEARSSLAALNRQSIMSPQLEQLMANVKTPEDGAAAPALDPDTDALVKKYGGG